jgi:hypothetical protein
MQTSAPRIQSNCRKKMSLRSRRLGRESEGEWCLTGGGGLVPGGDRRQEGHQISRPAAAAISSRLHQSVGSLSRASVLVASPSRSALPQPPRGRTRASELDGIPPIVISTQARRRASLPRRRGSAGGWWLPIESAMMVGLVNWEDAGVG